MAAENIDGTLNGTGLFPTKVPGLSDAADIQAALRLYHYGSYTYDGANTNEATLLANPSVAAHLQTLKNADATEVTNRNAAIATHNADTTDVHGIPNTANLATQTYVNTAISSAVGGVTGQFSDLAGTGLDWNSVDEQFYVVPRIANSGTVITKTSDFSLNADDVAKTILLSTSVPMNLTVPANATVEIPVGHHYNFVEIGTGRTTFFAPSGVTIGSKNGQLFLDGQYSKGTLVKIATNDWVLFGDVYEGVAVTPTPTAPTPTAPTPTAPTPVAPTPTPTAPEPTPTPTPVVQPVAPTPIVVPVAPTPTALPTLPTPSIGVYIGWQVYPGSVYATFNIANFDYDATYSSSMGTRNIEFPEEYIAENLTPNQSYTVSITVSKAGYTSATGSVTFTANPASQPTPAPVAPTPIVTPVAPTPVALECDYVDAPVYCLNVDAQGYGDAYQESWTDGCPDVSLGRSFCGVAPTPTPAPVAPTPTPVPVVGQPCCQDDDAGFCQGRDYYQYQYDPCTGSNCAPRLLEANSLGCIPAPTAPTPVAPTPVAPTPVAPTPVEKTETSRTTGTCIADPYCPQGGERLDTIYYSDGTSDQQYVCCSYTAPTPVAPTPVAPTPVAPTPIPVVAQACCQDDDAGFCTNVNSDGYGDYYNYQYDPCTSSNCSPRYVGRTFCGVPTPTPVAPTPVAPTPVAPTPVAPTPTASGCTYNGQVTFVSCPPNVCVYDNCGNFIGYTST